MELKINYQYTYFIHPFIIKDGKYQRYILKMLKDKNCELKIFQKEKDLKTYQYFLPKAREFLFSSFSLGYKRLKKLKELPIETMSALLSKNECNIFEYKINKDIQGKEEGNGIFFNIQKIDIVCFSTGVGFVLIKTNIEDSTDFSDILNFNYKFRDMNQEGNILDSYDNIRLQTGNFENAETFREFLRKITDTNIEAMKLNLNIERFLTYSYTCIDQENWNEENEFEKIKHYFAKYANIDSADSNTNIETLERKNIVTMSRWKYAKLALTKQGSVLLSSSANMNNYTILPTEYENEYLYTYILNLYKKIYLKKLQAEFKNPKQVKDARRKFANFTKNIWIEEITEDEAGTMLNQKIKDVLELERLYAEVKGEYDVLYKDMNIEKDRKSTKIIMVVLILSLIMNILNFIALMQR